jgi:4-amino-4-deoxy-L-arabinose transferase-like glycosyltransferase
VAASGVVSWVIARRVSWSPATTSAIVTVIAGVAIAALGFTRVRATRWAAAAVVTVLVVPFAWSVGSLKSGLSANLPYAMPAQQSGFGRPGGMGGGMGGGMSGSLDTNLIVFLEANRSSEKWLVAMPSAMTAGRLIIDTGEPVMALGGFSGTDQIVTATSFAALVKAGAVRYVYLGGMGGGMGGPPGMGGSSDVSSYVTSSCSPVTDMTSLYDCAPR